MSAWRSFRRIPLTLDRLLGISAIVVALFPSASAGSTFDLPSSLDASALNSLYKVSDVEYAAEFLRAFEVAFWAQKPLPTAANATLSWFEGRATLRLVMGRGREAAVPMDTPVVVSLDSMTGEQSEMHNHEGMRRQLDEVENKEETAPITLGDKNVPRFPHKDQSALDPRATKMRVHFQSADSLVSDDPSIWPPASSDDGTPSPSWSFTSWKMIAGSESSSFYGVSMQNAPVRGLVIHWTGAAAEEAAAGMRGEDLLILAPDLVPPCVDDWEAQGYHNVNMSSSAFVDPTSPEASSSTKTTQAGRRRLAVAAQANFRNERRLQFNSMSLFLREPDACYLPGTPERLFSSKQEATQYLKAELVAATAAISSSSSGRRSLLGEESNDSESPSPSTPVIPTLFRRGKRLLSSLSEERKRSIAARYRLPREVFADYSSTNTSTSNGARSLYIDPVSSRGTRKLLIVRLKFSGQADSVLTSDSDARVLADRVVTEANRFALGGATFTYSMPTQIIDLPSTVSLCSTNYDNVWAQAKSRTKTLTGLDSANFNNFVVFLPQTCASRYGWSGLATVGGAAGNMFINYAKSDDGEGTFVHELGHK
jgi:hypothetical protein